MPTILSGSIQIWYQVAADWTADDPILLAGQEGHESDTGLRKIGDGSTSWGSLPYIFGAIGPGTINNYAKFTGADAIGDAILSDDGNSVYLPNTKNFSSANTKTTLDFASGAGFNLLYNNGATVATFLGSDSQSLVEWTNGVKDGSLNISTTATVVSHTSIVSIESAAISIGTAPTNATTITGTLTYVDTFQAVGKVMADDGTGVGKAKWTTLGALGAGTVTSVSVVTNQGVSGSVATATTTPAITLSLGALTGVTSLNGLVVTANTGVVTTGTWNATVVTGTYGGSGVNNGSTTFTRAGNIIFTGAFNTTFATSFTGTLTLPGSASTLATLALAEAFTNKTGYNGLVVTANTGAITTGTWTATPVTVPYGGTGNTTFTAYSVICAGTTATGTFQNVSGVGTSGQMLTSAGAGALPTWTTPTTGTVTSASVVTNQGVSGSVATATTTPAITLTLGALTGVTSFNGLVVTANTGAITTGTWNGTVVTGQYGGTGVANTGFTITLAGSLVTTGAFTSTFAASATATYTLPTATSTLLANNLGISGGSTLIGGTAASETLTLSSTSNATKGKILFGTSAYDQVNNRLGIGQTTPLASIHITSSAVGTSNGLSIYNTSNGTGSYASVNVYNDTSVIGQFFMSSSTYNTIAAIGTNCVGFYSNGTGGIACVSDAGAFKIATGASYVKRLDISIAGLVTWSAAYHVLAAGTATAGQSPQKYTAGTLLGTIEALATEANAQGIYRTSVALNRYADGGYIYDNYADEGNVTTGETDMYSYTTKASTLAANGGKIGGVYGGLFVSSATATRQVKLYFAGTAIFDTGALTLSLSSAWTMYVDIIRVSATVVRYMISFTTEGAALAAYTAVGELTGLTLSGTNIIKLTGQAAGVGAATGDIVTKMGALTWYGASNN